MRPRESVVWYLENENIDHLLEFEIARDNNERRRTDTLSYHPNLILMCRQGSADLDVDATVN